MPALSGQRMMTIPGLTVTWFFDPVTEVLRNNPTAWTDPTGQTWPAGSGALIAANQLGRTVKVRINDEQGAQIRRVNLPSGGRAVKAAALASAPSPDGPYVNAGDLNGLTFDLS